MKATTRTNARIIISKLSLAEALELGHGAFHFLASSIGGGPDALDAQAEVVRVGCTHESFFEGDEIARVEIEDGLIECLHAVLAGTGGDGIANHARLVGVDDAIANVAGGDHHFHGGPAALAVALAHKALADDGLESAGELQANLFLLGWRKDGDDALN